MAFETSKSNGILSPIACELDVSDAMLPELQAQVVAEMADERRGVKGWVNWVEENRIVVEEGCRTREAGGLLLRWQ